MEEFISENHLAGSFSVEMFLTSNSIPLNKCRAIQVICLFLSEIWQFDSFKKLDCSNCWCNTAYKFSFLSLLDLYDLWRCSLSYLGIGNISSFYWSIWLRVLSSLLICWKNQISVVVIFSCFSFPFFFYFCLYLCHFSCLFWVKFALLFPMS